MSNNNSVSSQSISSKSTNVGASAIINALNAQNARIGTQVKKPDNVALAGIPFFITVDPNPLLAETIAGGFIITGSAGILTITLDSAVNIINEIGLSIGQSFTLFTYNLGFGTVQYAAGAGLTIVGGTISNVGLLDVQLSFVATSENTMDVVQIFP